MLTIRLRGIQVRHLGKALKYMVKNEEDGEGEVTSFGALCTALSATIGTGNIVGACGAILTGGPGAIFWMWIIALLGSSSAFVESTLAQLYKVRGKDSYIGGPAYYMKRGLKQPWMGIVFAILIIFTFAFSFNTVQSNTICAAFEQAFQVDYT